MKQYILIAILACGIQVQAQTAARDSAFQRTLILEREYNATIDKASKINTLPEVKEPQAPQAKIEYSNYSTPANLKPEPSQTDAARFFKDLESSKKRGYVRAGVSTFVDIDGDAGYQILNSEKDDLSLWLTHRSSSGNVKSLQTDEKLKLKLNDNIGAFRYSHNFESSKLFADAKYTYSKFNYYGGGFSVDDEPTFRYPFLHSDQTNNIFDTNMGILLKNTLPVDILLGVNFTHFEQKESLLRDVKGTKENSLKLNFDVDKDFNHDKLIGLAGYFRTNFYTVPDISDFDSYKNYGDLALNPYFKMEGDAWKMRLGVVTHFLFNQSKTFFYTPDVELSFRPYETGLLYLIAKGEVADNSNKNIFYENRYIVPTERVLDSFTRLDGTAGFKTSISGSFGIDFFAGYKISKQEHFYFPYLIITTNWNSYYPDYYDTKVLKLGTKLQYKYGKIFDICLKATYYSWDIDKPTTGWGGEAWNKPAFESDLTAGLNFQVIPLRIDMAYHLETGRKAYDFYGDEDDFFNNDIINMKNINDVSLTGTYSFGETFSIFAKADNLFNQKYDIWYGYPAAGFRFMGGLSLKF